MGSLVGEEVVPRKGLGHCKSHQRLWQVEEECGDQWEVKALMHFLEQLKI